MPRHEQVALVDGEWTQITNAAVTEISFQLIEGGQVSIAGTVGTTPPTAGGWRYLAGQGERKVALADLFPGIAATRVWAQMVGGSGRIMVSHA